MTDYFDSLSTSTLPAGDGYKHLYSAPGTDSSSQYHNHLQHVVPLPDSRRLHLFTKGKAILFTCNGFFLVHYLIYISLSTECSFAMMKQLTFHANPEYIMWSKLRAFHLSTDCKPVFLSFLYAF